MDKRLFTLEEARQLLPTVKKLVGRMVELSQRMEGHRAAVQALSQGAPRNGGSPEGTVYLQTLLRLQHCLAEIHRIGCLVKSIPEGLVDFPHLREGREVYLCWKHGEEDIAYWHEIEAGFAGRVPLSEGGDSH